MLVSRKSLAIAFRRRVRLLFLCALVITAFVMLGRSGAPFYRSALAADGATPDVEPNATNAIVNTTLEDFHLPGTQPNGLTNPLASCSGCHVDHISVSYAGSMMANSARDPLFRAALRVANEDANFAGEYCIRCHVPNAWLNGRSQPTDGSAFTAADMQGVTCNVCHRLVAPYAVNGEAQRDAAERTFIKNNPPNTSLIIGTAAYVVDRQDYRRGPFDTPAATHDFQQDSFMRDSLMCATCHEIDNPLLSFDATEQEFVLNTTNQASPVGDVNFPVERTYSEWLNSAFATQAGVTGLSDIYPGLKRSTGTGDGPITVCQDCHMPMEASKLTTLGTPDRTVGVHEWAGGSSLWQQAIEDFWDGMAGDTNFDTTAENATLAARDLGQNQLARAADLDIAFHDRQLIITVTNNTGHKLPSGYAEGRRMWLEVDLFQDSQQITTLGGLDADGNIIAPLKVYEIKQGISASLAQQLQRPDLAGEGFHFALNNEVIKDNRIPPRGWTNVQYESKHMEPVGVVYADGQYTDTTTYLLPPGVDEVDVKLMYQTASGEYLDFLETEANDLVDDNVVGPKVNWGQVVGNLRDQFDLDRGVEMKFTGRAVPTIALHKAITPSVDLLPGQPLTYTLFFDNPGLVSINDVSIADHLPASISYIAYTADLDGSNTINQSGNAPNLAWEVVNIFDPVTENKLYVQAKVNPLLNADTVISNTAVMSGTSAESFMVRSASASANVVVPRVQFAPASYKPEEDDGTIEVTVTMNKANPFADTKFKVSTQDATAKAGSDFVAITNQEITIAAGATSAKFNVQLVNDTDAENDESFNVLIKSSTGAAVGNAKLAKVTIENEDEGTPAFNNSVFLPGIQAEE